MTNNSTQNKRWLFPLLLVLGVLLFLVDLFIGSVHIPMGEIIDNMNNFHQNEKYIFVCRSGSRSARVTNYMISQDIEAYNMSGGMKELKNFTENIHDSEGNPGQII